MSTGRLVINGKTWGEFESAKRIKGHIVISGYESYGGCHTVRGIKQPELNEKQEYLLRGLICKFDTLGSPPTPFQAVYWLMHNGAWNGSSKLYKAITSLDKKQQAQVLRAFADWIEQEEK
ncbi:hypothetical protein IGL01_000705 [Enterococcus sp. DIV0340]|uniref:hypothetical protein n=1 Tax=unclassified Enterococcus TaxID=2608891 RepID=UPI003D2FA7BB